MKTGTALLAIVAVVAVLAWSRTQDYAPPQVVMAAHEVIVHEDSTAVYDVTPPTMLTVAMRPGGDHLERCNDMGGQLDGTLCRGVDY